MTNPKETAVAWIEDNSASLIQVCDRIWELAELGLVEVESARLIADELEKNGFRVRRGVAGMPTAFTAEWGEGTPVIGIMGEYDALPGLSQKRVTHEEPAEAGKPGHGCGHNIHGMTGVAAAIAVKQAMESHGLSGRIQFFGCPAEENFSGKVYMVRDGLFKEVEAVFSHHPSDMNEVSLLSSLAVNSAKFHFFGRASHAGGSPEQGRSALDAVELMNTGVNFLREHVAQDARIHYIIEKGGDQPNIVPSYARSWYYIRAPEKRQADFLYDWILDIARGAALMTRTEHKVELMEGCYNYLPSKALSTLIVRNMREIGPPTYQSKDLEFAKRIAETITPEMKTAQLRKSKRPDWQNLVDVLLDTEFPDPWGEGETSHGSTDVSDVSWQAPTVEFCTATWILGTPAHSWQAVAQSGVGLGHQSLIFASKVMACSIIELLTNEDELRRAREEYRQRMGREKYVCPIPAGAKPPLDIWEK